jgi:hypothetical protein
MGTPQSKDSPPPAAVRLRKAKKEFLGLRSGTDLKGDGYALTDYGDDVNKQQPAQQFMILLKAKNDDPVVKLWHRRLFNTVANIKALKKAGSMVIVSGAKIGNGERYNGVGTGGGTFAKCGKGTFAGGAILDEIAYTDATTVPDLLRQVVGYIDEMPDPGKSF